MKDALGKITATESSPTTTTTLAFWVQDDTLVRPFDIVRVKHVAKRGQSEPSYTYAIINELNHITDSAGHLASYVSSDFGDVAARPLNERLGTTLAFAEVLYNSQDVEMPVRDGSIVEWADEEGILRALGIKDLDQPIPAGFIRMSNAMEIPICVEGRYLIGPEGAHLNIAGISGLATKTSYAMFLLSSIQQLHANDTTMIVFNVKGRDLLHLDEEPTEADLPAGLTLGRVRSDWERCGLKAQPFKNVRYLYPFDKRPDRYYTSSHASKDALERQAEAGISQNYFYDVERGRRKLKMLFTDIEDHSETLSNAIDEAGSFNVADWSALKQQVLQRGQRGQAGPNNQIAVQSWRRFGRLLQGRTREGIFDERSPKAEKRMTSIEEEIYGMTPGQVLVIDIEPLPPYLQSFVVGDVIQTLLAIKLGEDVESREEEVDLGQVILFADELNKYAPRADRSGILTEKLRELTGRGRSLGMVLFGAEQFRSGVDDQVLGNCSTNVFGRTSPVEIAKGGDYRFMSKANQSSITGLPKGSLMLQHAIFRANLLKVNFPFPFYHQPK